MMYRCIGIIVMITTIGPNVISSFTMMSVRVSFADSRFKALCQLSEETF